MSHGTEKRLRTEHLTIRFTPEERAAIDAAAEKAGLTSGSYARQVLLGAPPPRQVRRPPVERAELARLLGELGHIGGNINQLAHTGNLGMQANAQLVAQAMNALVVMRDAVLKALGAGGMIIKGTSRAGPGALAVHLGNAEKNEKVSLLETKGTVAQDLRGALIEMDAYAAGTRCEKSLYHAAISPEPPHRLTDEQRAESIKTLEEKLGLTDHARVVVMHEKQGREHIHVVWSRIDLEQMRSVSDSHNYRKHEEVARDLERRFGHDRVQGAHHEREGVERPDRTPSRAELRQEERTGISGKEVKAEVTAAFRASDGPEAFKSALQDKGYQLAKGDKRDFVVIDHAGGIHSLARRIDGMKAAELREFMAPLNRENLPSTEEAKRIAAERAQQAEEARKARETARMESDYSRGADYVSQTTAARKEHQRRQERQLEQSRENTKDAKVEKTGKADDERRTREHEERQRDAETERSRESKASSTKDSGKKEMSDAARDRMARLLNSEKSQGRDRDDWEPDRQPTAPGGGRTRSR